MFLNKDSVYSFLGNASKVCEIVCTNLISSKNLMARRLDWICHDIYTHKKKKIEIVTL